ncbi:MAG: hypothetical protein AAF587_25775 [Bacteroidota bacterium]
MNKVIMLILFGLLSMGSLLAQIPTGFSYQAVARDSNGDCLADQLISIQLSILDDSASTNPIYQELFSSVQTNGVGHFQVEIGTGALQGGSPAFEDLNWNRTVQRRHLRIELSPNNDLNLQELGMTQILSVPYANAAANGKQFSNTNEDEFIIFYGKNGMSNASIGGLPDANDERNNGILRIAGDDGTEAVRLFAHSATSDPGSSGWVHIFGENGTRNIELSMLSAANSPNHGVIRLRADDDVTKVETGVDVNNAGFASYRGPNGSLNISINTSSVGPNYGDINIHDDAGTSQVALYIDNMGRGIVAGDVKNFFMDHPTKQGKEIWYASIEGPEAAAYERGTATLINGEAEILFSEHFEIVANPSTMTIMTSPWSAEAEGLAIIERTEKGFKVKELRGGKGNYQFDWEAKAVRKGWENYQVIRDKEKEPFASQNTEGR